MIDWNRVQELRAELGDADFAQIVELFLDEIEGVVMRLRHGDSAQLESDLHFLKGSAANLGFGAFGNMCQTGEAALRNGRQAAVDLSVLLECYASTKKEFVGGIAAFESGAA